MHVGDKDGSDGLELIRNLSAQSRRADPHLGWIRSFLELGTEGVHRTACSLCSYLVETRSIDHWEKYYGVLRRGNLSKERPDPASHSGWMEAPKQVEVALQSGPSGEVQVHIRSRSINWMVDRFHQAHWVQSTDGTRTPLRRYRYIQDPAQAWNAALPSPSPSPAHQMDGFNDCIFDTSTPLSHSDCHLMLSREMP